MLRAARATTSRDALARAFERGFLGLLPLLWLAVLLSVWISRDVVAFDFHHYYWPAGDRVLHGLSPYVHGPWYPSEVPVGFVYPAPTALTFAAVAVLPRGFGDVLFTAFALAAPLMTLRVLGVRDWRVYGVVLLWPPVTFGVQTANLSMIFTLAVALIWRARDRDLAVGVLLGVIVAMKLFLFPLGLFLLATRRYVALAYGVVTALCISAAAWLVLGFDELSRYRATVREFSPLREDVGYSVIGLGERLGAGRPLAYAIALACAGSAAVACLVLGWRGRESAAFVLGLSACLLATPILWLHYLAFLLVPLALRCPRLRPMWAVPLLLYVDLAEVHPTTLQVAIALMLMALLVAAALRADDPWRGRRVVPA